MINTVYFKEFPVLETQRLILRKFTPEDAKEVLSMRSDQKIMHHMDSNPHQSIEQSEDFIRENLSTYAEGKGIFWAITEKDSGLFIGDFAFWRIDSKNLRAEIGYTLKPDFWGRGYMKEAMDAAIEFGFNKLHLHSYEANINPKNANSRKILERTGFKKEAYFRENYYFDGRFLDSEIYCLLEKDFTPRKQR